QQGGPRVAARRDNRGSARRGDRGPLRRPGYGGPRASRRLSAGWRHRDRWPGPRGSIPRPVVARGERRDRDPRRHTAGDEPISPAADRWLQMTWLILIGLIPFAALGILLGHLLTAGSIGPAIRATTALFAFLGGTWFPIAGGGFIEAVAKELPSYWVVQASRA